MQRSHYSEVCSEDEKMSTPFARVQERRVRIRAASIRDWKTVLSLDTALRKKVDQKTRKIRNYCLSRQRSCKYLEGKQTIGIYPLLLDQTS
jgi:hypothetical protein